MSNSSHSSELAAMALAAVISTESTGCATLDRTTKYQDTYDEATPNQISTAASELDIKKPEWVDKLEGIEAAFDVAFQGEINAPTVRKFLMEGADLEEEILLYRANPSIENKTAVRWGYINFVYDVENISRWINKTGKIGTGYVNLKIEYEELINDLEYSPHTPENISLIAFYKTALVRIEMKMDVLKTALKENLRSINNVFNAIPPINTLIEPDDEVENTITPLLEDEMELRNTVQVVTDQLDEAA